MFIVDLIGDALTSYPTYNYAATPGMKVITTVRYLAAGKCNSEDLMTWVCHNLQQSDCTNN